MVFFRFLSDFLEKMKKPHLGSRVATLFFLFFLSMFVAVRSESSSSDASVMEALKEGLELPSSLGWTESDPCEWSNIVCTDKRVTRIQIGRQGLKGSLPPNLNNLTSLQVFEVQFNELTGKLPSFAGLSSLRSLLLSNNNFTSIPPDFFTGLSSLQDVYLDYNPFSAWSIPDSLQNASTLQTFSAVSANISGKIPEFLGGGDAFPSLQILHLSFNNLEGGLPASFSGSSIQSLWLNGQKSSSKLNGTIDVLQNMTELTEVWLQSNSFSGPIPNLSGLKGLKTFSLRDNSFTGPVPASLVDLPSLQTLNLTNNNLQGPTPKFKSSVAVDMIDGTNSFCLPDPGVPCDQRVNTLLSIAQSVGYPTVFAENWKGNDPCDSWQGLTCVNGNISVVNFPKLGLTGTISPTFSSITSLQTLILSDNNLVGTIPNELTTLPNLKELDVSNNRIYGKIPSFRSNVIVKTDGNPDIGKDSGVPLSPPGTPSGNTPRLPPGSPSGNGTNTSGSDDKKSSTGVVVGSVIGGGALVFIVGMGAFCIYRSKQKRLGRVQSPNTMVIHPRHSGSDQDTIKVTVATSSVNGGAVNESQSHGGSESGKNNMVISIQTLKDVTNNFSEENILGRGGFGTVYKGDLPDGTKIAVKRMESGVVTEKGLDEFKSEIAVLTKVRHRHLVALLGYCLDGNERLLVYEYMPQGTLSSHLFNWKEEGLKSLEWTKRLTVALDVARGVEYLHSLAHQSFVHRDLKPSNILLGDDMRAKVADFGLVRLAPDGKASVVTKLAGTFGYLAPEYAAMGRVTTKVDVFSFGVILMELITGRKALEETQQEESIYLVTYFRRIHNNKDSFQKAIDSTIDLDEETLASINTVAELAGHCCAREPYQRPDMSHAVNVLSSLAELWKPSDPDSEDMYGIDFNMTLPQAVKKWQALEGMSGTDASSSYLGSTDNTQTSIPTRPSGFADSFTSADGR